MNNNINLINAKELKQRIKHGHGTSYFTKKYNVTEEELFAHIDRAFSAKAAVAFKRDLIRNDKHPVPVKAKAENLQDNNAITSEAEETVSGVAIEPEDTEVPTSDPQKVTTSTDNSLISLIAREEELSRLLITEESKHSDLVSKRATLKEKFKEQQALLLDYQKKLSSAKQQFEETYSIWCSLGDEMKSQTSKISSLRDDLQVLREEIKILSKISILVYVSGEIELESSDMAIPSAPEKEHDLFNRIVEMECAEGLTVKNIRQLSKLKVLVDELNESSTPYEITFDTDTLEEVFNSIN